MRSTYGAAPPAAKGVSPIAKRKGTEGVWCHEDPQEVDKLKLNENCQKFIKIDCPENVVAMYSITMATSSPASPKELGRHYSCLWTLYNYDQYLPQLREYAKGVKYIVWGYEICPETKRPHLQGFVQWENKRSIGQFSKQFGNCHVMKNNGTGQQNRAYCIKDGKFEEFGELKNQGQRTDWEVAINQLKSEDVTDVIENQPQLLPCIKALERYKILTLKPKHREVNVIVLYGQAGSGKTRYCYENYSDIYSKPRGEWWDGYTGQKTILLDDYYGYMPYCELLRVLDRYPYQVPIKGGFVHAQWDTVLITSNEPPSQWYKNIGYTPALKRRLNKILYCNILNGIETQTDHSQAFEEKGNEEANNSSKAMD